MTDHESVHDQHLDPAIAAAYDRSVAARFAPEVIEPTVDCLAELAAGGVVVEFAIGTGRVALPLAARGLDVRGIDISEPMVTELRRKAGGDALPVTIGDMTEERVADGASLVYLVFNTIGNLRTQEEQVACFANAAAHLAPRGRFVVEVGVPQLALLPPGETIRPFDVSADHLGFDEFVDLTRQLFVSHHYFIDGDRVRLVNGEFRFVWPSELDLMARLAGLELEHRWSDWDRRPFDDRSTAHVSVWRKA